MVRIFIGSAWLGGSLAAFAGLNVQHWQFWVILVPTLIILTWRND
jgi:hypothetical protein